jgi:hypothetical protein
MFNRIRSEPLQKVPTKDPSITCHVLGTEPLGYDQMNIRQTGLAVSSSEKLSPSPDSIPLLDLHIAYANFHALNWNLSDTGRMIMDGAGENWLRPDHLSYDLTLPTFHNTSRESSAFVNHIKPMTESRYEEWEQSMGSYVFPGNPTGDHRNLLDFDPIDESTYIDSSEIMQEEVPKYFHHQPCISTEKSGLVSAPPLARRAQAQASAQNTLNDQLNDAPYSYLIWQALLAAPGNQLSLRDIYAWIQHNTDKPSRTVGNGWQNSIRYNLSMNTVSTSISQYGQTKLPDTKFMLIVSPIGIRDGSDREL